MASQGFIKSFQNNTKKDGYVNSYIRKYQPPTDKAEREKINKIKIKETLDNFSHDNTED
jgi:hypothetical protein